MELFLMTGLPGSGKSTVRAKLPNHILFNPDRLLIDTEGKYLWNPSRSAFAWASEYQRLGKWLSCGAEGLGVFDATLVNGEKRAPLLHIAKGYGLEVKAIFLDTPWEVCVERNNARTPDRRVPQKTMEFMRNNLRPPEESEGFDDVIVIPYITPTIQVAA
jgi:predicted kinase